MKKKRYIDNKPLFRVTFAILTAKITVNDGILTMVRSRQLFIYAKSIFKFTRN